MLLSKYFVFIHFPRAGGTFIRETLARHMPSDSEMLLRPGHDTVNDIPEQYQYVPRIGFIRNPWDWYVSVYSGWLGVKKNRPNAFVGHMLDQIALNDKEVDFRTFLHGVVRGPDNFTRGMSAMNWVYANQYGVKLDTIHMDPAGIYIARFERLREEILGFLEKTEMPITDAMRNAIGDDPPINGFERKPYEEYYDDELRDLVLQTHSSIIDKYNYDFGN